MKKNGDRALTLYRILTENTDEEHLLSMPELIALLEEAGIPSDRRAVYRSIEALNSAGFPVTFHRTPRQGYCISHEYTVPEAVILCNAVRQSDSLSAETSEALCAHIISTLSVHQQDRVTLSPASASKTAHNEMTENIEIILKAIRARRYVSFKYYDYTVTKQKRYRRNNSTYRMVPYALITANGRYYSIMYSDHYQSFSSYRIDKMDAAELLEPSEISIPFDAEAWSRSSFQMYRGEPDTVLMKFPLDMSNIVFDEFGYDLLITEVTDTSFTAALRTAVTPTLLSWILQFQDRITVLRPEELIRQMVRTAEDVIEKYGGSHEQQNQPSSDPDR